jgi:hypothetical protein
MPKDVCAERVRLEQEVQRAVNAVYATPKETEAARLARLAERQAVKALENHIRHHQCKIS